MRIGKKIVLTIIPVYIFALAANLFLIFYSFEIVEADSILDHDLLARELYQHIMIEFWPLVIFALFFIIIVSIMGRYLTARPVDALTRQVKIAGAVGGYKEITEPRLLERKDEFGALARAYNETNNKLKESEAKYSTLIEHSNDGITVLQDGKFVFLNPQIAKIIGGEIEDYLGTKFIELIALADRKMVSERYLSRLKGKNVESRYEFKIVNSDQRLVPVEVNASLIKYNGKPAVMAVVRDMTKAKELEKLKSEFVSVTSHQLRTPLTGIKWFMELLLTGQGGRLTKKQLDYLNQINESNERMIRLVDDLLNVSRMESSGKFKVTSKLEDVVKIFHNVIAAQKVTADKKRIEIVHAQPCIDSFKASVDAGKLSLVLQNILDNAIKFSPQGSTITIDFGIEGKNLIFSVADQGVGIPKDQQYRVFERFFRAENVLHTQPGTGLGLYIAKFLVEKHGGKIWFESEENKGTKFYISIPGK